MTPETPPPEADDHNAGTLFVEEPRFAIVPEWVIDAAVSDGAFRLYSLLLRYGNGSGCRMPSRQTLARRLRNGEQFLSNRYHVRTTPPAGVATADEGGGG